MEYVFATSLQWFCDLEKMIQFIEVYVSVFIQNLVRGYINIEEYCKPTYP